MKLSLNREYATRHLGAAILFAALSIWFAWDGAVKWPAENRAWEQRTGSTVAAAWASRPDARNAHDKQNRDDIPPHWPKEIDRQFQFAALLGLAAAVVGFRLFREWRRTLSWDDSAMCGPATGNRPIPFADIASVDERKWKKQGILLVKAKDGRRLVLDAWHHQGAKDLATLILSKKLIS